MLWFERRQVCEVGKIIQYFAKTLFLGISKTKKINVNPEKFDRDHLVINYFHLEWGLVFGSCKYWQNHRFCYILLLKLLCVRQVIKTYWRRISTKARELVSISTIAVTHFDKLNFNPSKKLLSHSPGKILIISNWKHKKQISILKYDLF